MTNLALLVAPYIAFYKLEPQWRSLPLPHGPPPLKLTAAIRRTAN